MSKKEIIIPEEDIVNLSGDGRKYSTLEQIRLRKSELADEIAKDNRKLDVLKDRLLAPERPKTTGQFISSMIDNGLMALDFYIFVRKLKRRFSKARK